MTECLLVDVDERCEVTMIAASELNGDLKRFETMGNLKTNVC